MATKQRRGQSELLRGFSQATEIFKRLEKAVHERGGTYLDIARLAKDEGLETVNRIATLITNGGAASYKDLIELGHYDEVLIPEISIEELTGQKFHRVEAKLEAVEALDEITISARVYEKFRDSLADPSEFLDYCVKNRAIMKAEEVLYATAGLHEGKLWIAVVYMYKGFRKLIIQPSPPHMIVNSSTKLVLRKES